MNNIPTTVLLADDHPVFRRGLRMVIASDPQFNVLDEAADGLLALARIRELRPDVALLDINMPQQSGIEVARTLQREQLNTRVVFLTMHRDEATFNAALDLGASGYLLKESAVEEIVSCLKAVAAGEKFVSPQLSTFLLNRGSRVRSLQEQKPSLADLTPAELRVLKLIAEQKTTREIAELLFISPRTVERHRENICTKLELRGSNALLKFALENKQVI
ncbi:MAG: response regulator transcription factor [Acidobacteriota bacterium]